jgi:hypothetical protein
LRTANPPTHDSPPPHDAPNETSSMEQGYRAARRNQRRGMMSLTKGAGCEGLRAAELTV